jgi:hypothetical protein
MANKVINMCFLPISALGNLQLNNRDRSIIIITTQILILNSINTIRQDGGAYNGIRLSCPNQRRRDGVAQICPLEPAARHGLEAAGPDLLGQALGPALGVFQPVPAHDLLGDAGVPDVVKVGVRAPESDVDAVAAAVDVLGVERLVHVADELDV